MRSLRKALWAFQRAYGGCVVVSTTQLPSSGGTIYPSHSSRAEMWTAREERESIIRAVLKRAADPADYLDASDGERAVAAAALVVGQPTGNG
ncbi:DUF4259 domain-containing protein [Streptomyces anulatus]|uniref:DUF4259 domain-containing protein n=1 Tax=Streptomyces anulatus TaxID=1892 RepID=UPI0036AA066E